MSKALENGKSLLDVVLAKLPESLRADAQKAFTSPEATDALTVLGDSALARADYSKHMDEVRATKEDLEAREAQVATDYERLNNWWKTNEPKLAKVGTLEAEIAKLKGEPPPKEPVVPTGDFIDKKTLAAELEATQEGGVRYLNTINRLSTQHLRDFQEILDADELVALARKKGFSVVDAYHEKFAEKLAAKRQAEEDVRINKRVEERLAEERKKNQDQPFPLRNQSPSVLDIFSDQTDSPSKHTLDTATAEYERLQAARG